MIFIHRARIGWYTQEVHEPGNGRDHPTDGVIEGPGVRHGRSGPQPACQFGRPAFAKIAQ